MVNIFRKSRHTVFMEDHADYYKEPPIRSILAKDLGYEDAVQFAKDKVIFHLDTLEADPASIYIVPEPKGKHFDSRAFEAEIRMHSESLVKRIGGERKGTAIPAFQHSYNVQSILRENGYNSIVCLAGLLHDVIEDANASSEELQIFGDRVVELVRLCSHDASLSNGDARWVKMLSRLIDANDEDAWAIKLADSIDNVRGSVTMQNDRGWFVRNVKGNLLLSLTKDFAHLSVLRKVLAEQIEEVNSKAKE